jgi:hypothetical protein
MRSKRSEELGLQTANPRSNWEHIQGKKREGINAVVRTAVIVQHAKKRAL